MGLLYLWMFIIVTLIPIHTASSLTCYSCNVGTSMCNRTTLCASNEICIKETLTLSSGTTVYKSGCEKRQVCNGITSAGHSAGKRASKQQYCCSSDLCNGVSAQQHQQQQQFFTSTPGTTSVTKTSCLISFFKNITNNFNKSNSLRNYMNNAFNLFSWFTGTIVNATMYGLKQFG